MSDYCVVMSTIDDEGTGAEIARRAVEQRLAASANIIKGVRSVYRWQGETVDKGEVLMMFYTRSALSDSLGDFIKSAHPYEVPAIVRVEIAGGWEGFLSWVGGNTASSVEDY